MFLTRGGGGNSKRPNKNWKRWRKKWNRNFKDVSECGFRIAKSRRCERDEGTVMKGKKLFSSIVLIGALLFHLSEEGFAGVAVEQVVRDQDGVPSKTLLYLSETQFRTDHQERGLTTILDFKKDRLVMIDHRSKNYVEVKLSLWERDVAKKLKKESPA